MAAAALVEADLLRPETLDDALRGVTAVIATANAVAPTHRGDSHDALARIEAQLLPEIEAAETRARAAVTSPLVAEVAGSDVRERWARLGLPQRREIVSTLMEVRILPTVRGARTFRAESVEIAWR